MSRKTPILQISDMSHVERRLDKLPASGPSLPLEDSDTVTPKVLGARTNLFHAKTIKVRGMDIFRDLRIHSFDDTAIQSISLKCLAILFEEPPIQT